MRTSSDVEAQWPRGFAKGGKVCVEYLPTITAAYMFGRYCNVDFVVMSSLKNTKVKDLLFSYDINCQWSRNLEKRMGSLPKEIQLNLDEIRLYYGIPKFHLEAGHGEDCQGPYSLNLKKGVGRTDGEGIERNWSHANGAAHSTREMGPGSRHDTLDDHFGHANWRRTIELRELFPILSRLTADQNCR